MSLQLLLRTGDEVRIGEAIITLVSEAGHGPRRVKLSIDAPREVRVTYTRTSPPQGNTGAPAR